MISNYQKTNNIAALVFVNVCASTALAGETMTSLFCCSNNQHCVDALCIIKKSGINVNYILSSEKSVNVPLKDICDEIGAELIFDSSDARLQENKFDFLISFAYQRLIPAKLIHNADHAINFHPAPLPYYKGRANTIQAILNGETEWGATCHYLDESFDTGKIIEKHVFTIDHPNEITGKELADISWGHCLKMLESVLGRFLAGEIIDGTPQIGEGKYYSMKDLQGLKEVKFEDGAAFITRKVNALWFPPFEGAYIMIDGVKFYLITDTILDAMN